MVDEGIIITDGINEFVWVPVDDPSTMFVEETVKLNGVETTTTIYSKLRIREGDKSSFKAGKPGNESSNIIREPDVLSIHDTDKENLSIFGYDTVQEMAEGMVAEYKAMSDSVKKYKGFYIGRYELTGILERPTERIGKVLSADKAGNWYYLYKACKDVIKNNSDVKSTMIYGCQWDETCNWLKKTKFKGQEEKVDVDSSEWGNCHNPTAISTGTNSNYKANEIYDMSGNYMELTQEAGSSNERIMRTNDWHLSNEKNAVTRRNYENPEGSYDNDTTRATLYIK